MTGSPDRSSTKISSVLLCSDVLATRESEQKSNLRWFADLLARPIGQALPDANVRRVLGTMFVRGDVLLDAVGKEGLKQRHCWFDPDTLDVGALAKLRQAIGEDTLLVGYDMSRWTRKALSGQGISWIDIWLHPVRFADDILFAVRASDEKNAGAHRSVFGRR